MSTSPWATFDWPWRIDRINTTGTLMNQTTGELNPAVEATTQITGNFVQKLIVEETRTSEALLERGDAILYTETFLDLEDRLKIYLDGTNTTSWSYRVKGIMTTNDLFGKYVGPGARRGYILKREVQ